MQTSHLSEEPPASRRQFRLPWPAWFKRSTLRLILTILLLSSVFGARPVLAGGLAVPARAQSAVQPLQEWVQTGPPDTGIVADAKYANSTAVNGDGSVIVIGAGSETVSGKLNQGAVYVRRHSLSGWTYAPLIASDSLAGDHFGVSVAVSGDGSTILVGAYQAKIGANTKAGAAYVFTWSGTTWTQQAKLSPSSAAANLFFGASVALNNDGSTALVGANGYSATYSNQGAAYPFTRSGSTWSQQGSGPLTEFDAALNDFLGSALALSADGNTALVSATGKANNQGAAYVYLRAGTSWAFQHKMMAWDGVAGDDFGRSVALSGDGSTALIGADNASLNSMVVAGAAYTFRRSGASWSNGARLEDAHVMAGDWFGYSLSLSTDGSLALIGAPRTQLNVAPGQPGEGAAYLFFGTGLGQSQRIAAASGETGDLFGAAVGLAGDGSLAVLGAPNLTWGTTHQGGLYSFLRYTPAWVEQLALFNSDGAANDWLGAALAVSADGKTAILGSVNMNEVFIYSRANGVWSLQAAIPSNDPVSQNFGAAVALSGDGNTALVGAWQAGSGGTSRAGAAYLITRAGTHWSDPLLITSPTVAAQEEFGQTVALSSDGSTAAIGASNRQTGTGAVYILTNTAGTWSAPTRYTASDPAAYAYFGTSLALSADGGTLLVGADGASNGTTTTGAAYVLTRAGGVYTEQKKLFPPSGYADSNYGAAVALSADGNTALVGAPFWGSGSINGLVYFYSRSAGVWSTAGGFSAPDNSAEDLFGHAVALSADGTWAAIGGARVNANGAPYQGAVYLYNHPAASWNLQAKLIPPEAVPGEEDGYTLALSGDGHTLLFNADSRDSNRGGVYFYTDTPKYPLFLPLAKR